MNCLTCYYAQERYAKDGHCIGVDCTKDNMRFIEYDIAICQYCGAYAERDDRDE